MTKNSTMPNISTKNDEKFIATSLQIAEKLKQARVSANLSEGDLAEKIGIKRTTYAYWEQKMDSIENLQRAAAALNLPLSYFLSDEYSVIDEKTVSLERIDNKLDVIHAHLFAHIVRASERFADQDVKKADAEMERINKYAEQFRKANA